VKEQFDLVRTFVHLDNAGNAKPVKVTPSSWRDTTAKYERVLGAFDFNSDDDLHASMQEMHPEADEVLFVVSGAVDVLIEEAGVENVVCLEAGEAAVVGRGRWHRLAMRRPGKLLFINSRVGMQGRDAS